ncbi:MAG: magnesium transporter [Oceanicoccus sp.]|jgi:magnesium transporter
MPIENENIIQERNPEGVSGVISMLLSMESESEVAYSEYEALLDEDIAQVIESIPLDIRLLVWKVLPASRYWSVLYNLQEDTTKHLIESLDEAGRQTLQAQADSADLLLFADIMPTSMVDAILLDQEDDLVEELQQALSYDDSQVGRHLNSGILRVRPRVSLSSVAQRIRKKGDVKAVFVVSEDSELLGTIPLHVVFEQQNDVKAEVAMLSCMECDHFDELTSLIARLDPEENLSWLPVRRNGKIVGAIPVSVLLWEAQERVLQASIQDAPSAEEDLFTPVSAAAKLRAVWLCINLVTAFMASFVIGYFEVALQQVVALAILMPVVASMGGIAGSQTLAVALRGLALNHITSDNIKLILQKEMYIAAINSALLGVIIALVVMYWFDSIALGLIIFISIFINGLAAASSGTLIPFLLKKVNIDPAISGSVILTTVTDVVGFVIFLGLGSFILLS